MAEQSNGLSFFIVGVGVGVAVGMLLAPRSGEETRQLLREKADDSKDFLRAKADETARGTALVPNCLPPRTVRPISYLRRKDFPPVRIRFS